MFFIKASDSTKVERSKMKLRSEDLTPKCLQGQSSIVALTKSFSKWLVVLGTPIIISCDLWKTAAACSTNNFLDQKLFFVKIFCYLGTFDRVKTLMLELGLECLWISEARKQNWAKCDFQLCWHPDLWILASS